MTDFKIKCKILSDLWQNKNKDSDWADFFEYNDVGLPLAFIIEDEIAAPTKVTMKYIDETFALLIDVLELDSKSKNWESLKQMLKASPVDNRH
jgi:hypothetical protein